MAAERTHACYDTDARSCWDLRYYGYSPVLRGELAAYAEGEEVYFAQDPGDDGECECPCHGEEDDGLTMLIAAPREPFMGVE